MAPKCGCKRMAPQYGSPRWLLQDGSPKMAPAPTMDPKIDTFRPGQAGCKSSQDAPMRAPNKANPKEAPKMTTQDGWFPRGFDIVKMPLATNAQMAFVKTTMCLYCAKIPAEVSERPVAEECERPVAEECERPVAE